MLTPELVEKGTLTDKERSVVLQYSVYLLYWYKSTNADT
jgi:hypothetical protein